MRGWKMHAGGNAFLVCPASILEKHPPSLLCESSLGIGADGLVSVLELGEEAMSVELYNKDGGRAELSGNGFRLAALAGMLERGLSPPYRCRISSCGFTYAVTVEKRTGPRAWWVEMELPPPPPGRLAPEEARGPVSDMLRLIPPAAGVWRVDLANPHLVIRFETQEEAETAVHSLRETFAAEGPPPLNVGIVRTEGDTLRLQVFERGVGETSSCASGACAAFLAMLAEGAVPPRSSVRQPGGTLRLELGGSTMKLGGECCFICGFDLSVPSGVER